MVAENSLDPAGGKSRFVHRKVRGEMKFKYIALLVLVVLGTVLFVQNAQIVTVKLFFWQVSMSGTIMFPLLVLVGFILGYLVCRFGGKKR